MAIELRKVSFSYPAGEEGGERRQLLRDLNLVIEPGEYVALLGCNGSGKSTTAKLMNGLLVPSEGEVVVDGLVTSDPQEVYGVRQRVGMVFQDPSRQLVASTIEDELAFGLENLGLPPEEIEKRLEWALKALGIEELRYKEPHYLSGGQTQRVAIASVLVMQPRYLIMDEPTAMLDPQGRREVLEAIDFLRSQLGMAVIYITHHMEEVWRAERVLALAQGQLVLDATPRQLFQDGGRLLALGLDLPPLIRLQYELQKWGWRGELESDWRQLGMELKKYLKS